MIKKYFLHCLQPLVLLAFAVTASAQAKIDFSQYRKDGGIAVAASSPDTLQITWTPGKNLQAEIIFDLRDGQPLIRSLGISEPGKPIRYIATELNPVTTLTIGERDKQKADEGFQQ